MKFYGEINLLKTPLLVFFKTKESWDNYNSLFSQESLALSQLSHTFLDKTNEHLANSQPLKQPALLAQFLMNAILIL